MYDISGDLCPLIIGLIGVFPLSHILVPVKSAFVFTSISKYIPLSKLGSEYIALNLGDWLVTLIGLTSPSVSKLVGDEGGWLGISSLLIVALLEEFFLMKSTLMYGGSLEYGCSSPVML